MRKNNRFSTASTASTATYHRHRCCVPYSTVDWRLMTKDLKISKLGGGSPIAKIAASLAGPSAENSHFFAVFANIA
jgi:hypothetical protein